MRAKLQQWIADHRSDLLADLAALIEVPSVARPGADGLPYGKDCAEALRRAEAIARKLGFATDVWDDTVLTAEWGGKDVPFCLLCHLDVVPAGDGWEFLSRQTTIFIHSF